MQSEYLEKTTTCRKSLSNLITHHCIECTSPWEIVKCYALCKGNVTYKANPLKFKKKMPTWYHHNIFISMQVKFMIMQPVCSEEFMWSVALCSNLYTHTDKSSSHRYGREDVIIVMVSVILFKANFNDSSVKLTP
jgi:hypothetical protein